MKKFPVFQQFDQMDCGPTCLKMIAAYYGKDYPMDDLRERCYISRDGVNLQGINMAAESLGFRSLGVKLSFEQLNEEARLPCILHWNNKHYVVLPPQDYNASRRRQKIKVIDPGMGTVRVSRETFIRNWVTTADGRGIALLLEPTPAFYNNGPQKKSLSVLQSFMHYLKPYYRSYLPQLVLGMFMASVLSLLFPFLTQILVDKGINQQDKSFIFLILVSQLTLFAGSSAIEIIRAWLLLHMNSRINISIISDFLFKLMRLPIRFFDTKKIGDITQRINDHEKIDQFLTVTSLNTLFSIISLVVFLFVLGGYSFPILACFALLSIMSIGWIFFFLRKRAELIYSRFQSITDNQNSLYELITGMQEIKLSNSETMHRWNWERGQARIFHLSIKSLILEQYQGIGSTLFTQVKNIIISYISAIEVVNGRMSLGEMLSVSYIVGQLNAPLDHLLSFIRNAQDAKISMQRLNEIRDMKEEEQKDQVVLEREEALDEGMDIRFRNVSFRYSDPDSPLVLDNINLTIPAGKVTAIVGTSGSGKTTLLKMLLKFYEPASGELTIGPYRISDLSAQWWRGQCGVVMESGFIFSDTIEKNISIRDHTDPRMLRHALKVANLNDFIASLPHGEQTKIGSTGNGISAGQRQRVLIARAVYKDPAFIFFDEATSALDANNEKVIIDNLDSFFNGRTVLIIAHRLSTVRHADQIVVLEKGRIVETGNHESLSRMKGKYFELVKNQLELNES